MLNEEQLRAHNMIENHLKATLSGHKPPQLLMMVLGQGGTGKTLLINAISETFRYWKAESKLAKTATSGVAASLIGGQTLHSWASLPVMKRDGGPGSAAGSQYAQDKRQRTAK